MEGLFATKKFNGGSWKAPAQDLFGVWDDESEDIFKVEKKNIILPGVTYREGQMLKHIEQYVKEKKKLDWDQFKVPQHLIEDVYSMYVNKNFSRKPPEEKNRVRQSIIDKAYDSLTKSLTQNSSLYSTIITKEIALWMQEVMEKIEEDMKDKDPSNDPDKIPNPQQADDDTVEKVLNDMSKKLDKALKDGAKKMDELEKSFGKDALKELEGDNVRDIERLDDLIKASKKSLIVKDQIHRVLKKILNRSENYFSKKAVIIEESLFECEQCEDLAGLEFLSPIFKKAGLLDIVNQTRKPIGKMDLYLDCSGSMDWTSDIFEGGYELKLMDLVKCIAVILFRMGFVEKLYFFHNTLIEIEKINELNIFTFRESGGTNFDNVVEQIIKNDRNSVVITDGEDSVTKYTDKAFFVGVGGTEFPRGFENYKNAGQCVTKHGQEFVWLKNE